MTILIGIQDSTTEQTACEVLILLILIFIPVIISIIVIVIIVIIIPISIVLPLLLVVLPLLIVLVMLVMFVLRGWFGFEVVNVMPWYQACKKNISPLFLWAAFMPCLVISPPLFLSLPPSAIICLLCAGCLFFMSSFLP